MELSQHPLIIKLRSLHLPASDYVVAGSGPLLAHGLRRDLGDLDLVARGKAWELALSLTHPTCAPSGNCRMILLCGGDIEVFEKWLPGTIDSSELIDKAELIDGIPFCPLRTVRDWKSRSVRRKDQVDTQLIEAYLHQRDAI